MLALPLAGSQSSHEHGRPLSLPPAAPSSGETVINVPPVDAGADTLEARGAAERASLPRFKVEHDFRFTDRLLESGITFVQQIVDDAGKAYKAAHYDHGNGIAVADVDGDGLPDIYFVSQLGGNQLWKNLGNGKFRNITAEAGVAVAGKISVSATFADIDNDGDQDLYVTTVRGGNVLFENDGKGHFKDITQKSGLGYVGHSSAAVFFDYDRDGRLDLLLVNVGKYTTDVKGKGGYYVAYEDAFKGHMFPERTEYSVLYHNEGGNRFVDVSAKMGLRDGGWSGDASICDFNEDGWPDLYILNMQGDNHYWENQGGKAFVEKTAKYFPKTSWGAMGIKLFDFDNDGRMDLLVTDMHSDMVSYDVPPQDEKLKFPPAEDLPIYQGAANNIFGNSFYRNLGGGRFAEMSDELNLENFWPWGVSVDDLNADGWDDVVITASMNFPFRYGVNSVLLNNQGEVFLDSASLLGVEPRRGGRTRKVWLTLDCGGEDKDLPQCKGTSGRYAVTGTLGSRSSAVFDLDGDGDLDIVTNEFNAEPQVLISDLAQRHKIHWLKVRLTGTASNRNGLGAMVKVHVGRRVLTKVMDGNSGYLSHSILPLYFGLDQAEKVDEIEVKWPSGRTQTLAGPIAANRQLEVTEPVADTRADTHASSRKKSAAP
ncbi:MAG TPA: CRTAC1 family protein [Thermoanaerobaculia bacterium]